MQTLKPYALCLAARAELKIADVGRGSISSYTPHVLLAANEAAAREQGLEQARELWPESEGYTEHDCAALEISADFIIRAQAAQIIAGAFAPALFDPVALVGYAVEQIEMATRAAALFRSVCVP